jgi:hypothetical protein
MPRPMKPLVLDDGVRRDTRPANFYETIADLGLRVISHSTTTIVCSDGTPRFLPRDLVGRDGKTVVIWREKDRKYAIDGWEPWHDGMSGGRCSTIGAALGWVQTAKDIRAGKRSHF